LRSHAFFWLKWTSLLLAVGSAVVAIALIWSAGPDLLLPNENPSAKPNTEVDAPVIVERKDGRVLWQLRAVEANQQLDGKMHLLSPHLRLYTEAGEEINIEGNQAWFNPIQRDVEFSKAVIVHYQDWVLNSESLIYDSSQDQIRIPDAFTLHGKTLQARGKNMIFLRNSGQIQVNNGIWMRDSNTEWQGVAPL